MMSKALIPSEMKNPGLDWLGQDPLLLDNRNCEFSEQFEIGYDHNHNHRCEENANPSLTTQYYVCTATQLLPVSISRIFKVHNLDLLTQHLPKYLINLCSKSHFFVFRHIMYNKAIVFTAIVRGPMNYCFSCLFFPAEQLDGYLQFNLGPDITNLGLKVKAFKGCIHRGDQYDRGRT